MHATPETSAMVAELRWDDIRLFLTAHRAGTLAAAGEQLGVDASTMSRRLAALEELIGARLFDRTRDGLVPTQAADVVLVGAEEMEAAHLRVLRDASSLERSPEGVVRLSVPPGFAESLVGPTLVRLLSAYPNLRVELDATMRDLDFTRRDADLALLTSRPQGGDLVMKKVYQYRWVALASPSYAAELGRLRSWDHARWIAWGHDHRSLPAARWISKYVRCAPTLATSHLPAQLAAIATGLGVGLVPGGYSSQPEFAAVRYTKPLAVEAEQWPVDGLWLVGHRALRGVPRVAAVWKFLVDEVTGFAAACPAALPLSGTNA